MKIIDPAYEYELDYGQLIRFNKKENGELIHNGTTSEELLAVVLDRTKLLDAKFPSPENKTAIINIQRAIWEFEERTRQRIARGVEGKDIV